jgi:hypothetical protein
MTDTKKYNKFYFLHIQKTGGRHLMNNVIYPIMEQLNKNGIKNIVKDHLHTAWHSEIDEKTYVVASLRDPVEQAVSLYAHVLLLNSQGFLKNRYDDKKLTKKDFYEWLKSQDDYPGFQAKSFLCDEFFFKREHPKSKPYVSIEFNENLLNFRKNQVNLFLNNNNISGRELEIQNKIFLDLGINGTTVSKKNSESFFNDDSKILYSKFTEKEKEILKKYNSIDNNLYINTNYF